MRFGIQNTDWLKPLFNGPVYLNPYLFTKFYYTDEVLCEKYHILVRIFIAEHLPVSP